MKQKIIDNLKKLKSMSSDESSQNEAMIAFKMYRKLLDKHQLSDLDVDEAKVDEKLIIKNIDHDLMDTLNPYNFTMLVTLFDYNDIGFSLPFRSESDIFIYGDKHDVDLAEAMVHHVYNIMSNVMLDARHRNMIKSKREMLDYRNGFLHGVTTKVSQMIIDKKQQGSLESNSLAVTKTKNITDKYKHYVTLASDCKKERVGGENTELYAKGFSNGKKINVGKYLTEN